MRFLITCYRLDLSGSSTYTFTLASELKKRGHEVDVFSPFPEMIANELKKKKIKVHKNLEEIANEKYSCIIAQHNVLALMIRSIKPEVPMVFVSHSTIEFLEQPPSIDINIQKYVAISEAVKNNLVLNHDIPTENIEIVRNFVDVNRFFPRREINERPKVLLLLSSRFTSKVYATIERACKKLQLELIVIGKTKQVLNVDDHINDADIVISLGRGILEAMACGRAAIVYDYQGGDGMITSNTIKEIRKWHFSGKRFKKDYDVTDLVKEIQKYKQSMGEINREIALKDYNASLLSDKIINICNQAQNNFCPRSISILSEELIWYQNQIKNLQPINANQKLDTQSNFYINALAALNELQTIHNSHGWQFLLAYYKFRDKIFPPNTRRRTQAKSLWKIVNKMIRVLSKG